MMRLMTAVALLCGLLVTCSGCAVRGIDAVRKGMMPFDVETVMGGEPVRKIRGGGVDIDKETHVYPTGRIHFFKKRVVYVEKKQQEKTISEKARELRERERYR